jgi:16S rRNA C967 or C1407 C5-methylase (RsmB/RsmF family)
MSHRSRNRKKRLGNKKKEAKPNVFQQDTRPDLTNGTKWTITSAQEKQNALFETFYRELVPADEFPAFMDTLRSDLPIVFRTIPSSVFASFVTADIEAQFPAGQKVQVGEEWVDPPRQLNWCPSVWQFRASRKETRQQPKLAEFKKWLVGSADSGQVVRQEAVSMIPPLLLEARDGHVVLDTCAAPGSKTTQLLEAIHSNGAISTGLVIANELDENRARMLTHRLKAITSPNLIISNHDARMFPKIHLGVDLETGGGGVPLDFDRILCDVPCTGDGTLRKAADLWIRWSPEMAKGIHGMQLQIAQRSVRMLKEGGRMVYSTCSMNPMEDEAVVAELLRWSQGAMQLVDASHLLPLFRRSPGVSTWRIMGKTGEFVDPAHEDAKIYQPSMWPPTKEEAEQFKLERCWRIYPHHQDTGGFFCAVLEKVSVLPGATKRAKVEEAEGKGKEESEVDEVPAVAVAMDIEKPEEQPADAQPAKEQRKKRVRRNYESPYIMVDPNSEAGETVRQGIEYFGLDLDPRRFMVRNEKSVG